MYRTQDYCLTDLEHEGMLQTHAAGKQFSTSLRLAWTWTVLCVVCVLNLRNSTRMELFLLSSLSAQVYIYR